VKICRSILTVGSRPYDLRATTTVVIAPHQDDESLGCGGLIARKRNDGLPVHVIFITDGSASHPDHRSLDATTISALRISEAKQALACLGVERSSVHFLNEPDGTLDRITRERRENLVATLGELLRDIRPDELFLPCYPDGSSEHDAAFGFVTEAITRAQIAPTLWQYPVWAWWNPALLLRGWLGTRDCRRLPAEDYHSAKQQAIQCYRSQIEPLPPDTAPALPPDLVALFGADTEFFFRYEFRPQDEITHAP
jgi:LmbE family N-acetylglucosaminyl deacetylase